MTMGTDQLNPYAVGDIVRIVERPSKTGTVVEVLSNKIVGVDFPGHLDVTYSSVEFLELITTE